VNAPIGVVPPTTSPLKRRSIHPESLRVYWQCTPPIGGIKSSSYIDATKRGTAG
jgi:hypothetical protein